MASAKRRIASSISDVSQIGNESNEDDSDDRADQGDGDWKLQDENEAPGDGSESDEVCA